MAEQSLESAELWVGQLIAKLEPAARTKLARAIAKDLRKSEMKRIAEQRNVDGSAYEPRKRQDRPALRSKTGRIKRKAAAASHSGPMFAKLRKEMRAKSSADEVRVGFGGGSTSRIARVHQEGLVDAVTRRKDSARVAYAKRELLGFTDDDRARLLDLTLAHLEA